MQAMTTNRLLGSGASGTAVAEITLGSGLSFSGTTLNTVNNGTVTSVSGTTNRITVTGTTAPVVDISSSYAGQNTITTVGTIGTGTWNGSMISSAYGGTGNGFTKFSGPTTSEKTFTLPDVSATILTSNTPVTVAQGGTGTTTGSITGSGALTFAAGGTNQNVTLTPSGTGRIVLSSNVGIGSSSNALSRLYVADNTTTDQIGVDIVKNGAYAGSTSYGLSVNTSDGTYSNGGIYCGVSGASSNSNMGIAGSVSGASPNNYGTIFNVTGGTTANYGISMQATGSATTNYGGKFTALGANDNYGIYSVATSASGNNYGAYLSASGGTGNYGLFVANGNVGIGATATDSRLNITENTTTNQYGMLVNKSGAMTYSTGIKSYVTSDANTSYGIQSIVNSGSTTNEGVYCESGGGNTNYGFHSVLTGANFKNIGACFYASGATYNYGLLVPSGMVGIGTMTPSYPLEVSGGNSSSGNINYTYYAYNICCNTINNNTIPNISIKASDRIVASEFDAISDQRIKKVDGRSDTRNDLETVKKLQVTDYRYIDVVSKGDKVMKGFIAQEVEKVAPGAVSQSTDFIPNIYAVSENAIHNSTEKTLTVKMIKAHGLAVGDEVRLISEKETVGKMVTKVLSENEFVVSDWSENLDKVFVFGKKVDDFRTVDYDRLFTTGIGAIQELSKEIENLKAENQTLQSKLNDMDQLKAEVENLKKAVYGTAMEQK